MNLKSLRDIAPEKLKGKRVLVRCDFDISEGVKIKNDLRFRSNLETLRFILRQGALVRIINHRGRPAGKDKKFSQRAISQELSRVLGKRIVFIKDPLDLDSFKRFNLSKDIIFFENIRFFKEEENNNLSFAKKLARWGDIYINEAFSNSHRLHASMVALPKILPAYAGFNLAKEVGILSSVIKKPKRPLVAVLGGAKLETKLPLIEKFAEKADRVLIGGAIANEVLSVKGAVVGKSKVGKILHDPGFVRILTNRKLYLPEDVVTSTSLDGKNPHRIRLIPEVKTDEYIVDLGPQSVKIFSNLIKGAKTILWNGPFGLIEVPAFSAGTLSFAKSLGSLRAFKVVGGGDTLAVLQKHNLLRIFTHVSTGGGAMLEFLAGKKLLPLEVLKK